MNKYIKIIVLILLLIAIWGIIAYKIYEHGVAQSHEESNDIAFKYTEPSAVKVKDYHLKLNYRDPFLSPKEVSAKTDKLMQATNVRWPNLEYRGCIYRGRRKLGFLDFSGNLEFVRKGQEVKDMLVRKIYKDSILLVFKGDIRVFKIKS
jgi:hypothetical protein